VRWLTDIAIKVAQALICRLAAASTFFAVFALFLANPSQANESCLAFPETSAAICGDEGNWEVQEGKLGLYWGWKAFNTDQVEAAQNPHSLKNLRDEYRSKLTDKAINQIVKSSFKGWQTITASLAIDVEPPLFSTTIFILSDCGVGRMTVLRPASGGDRRDETDDQLIKSVLANLSLPSVKGCT